MTLCSCLAFASLILGCSKAGKDTREYRCGGIKIYTSVKSSSQCGTDEAFMLFAIAADGKVAVKDSSFLSRSADGDELWKLNPGTYRIWGVTGYDTSFRESLWACNSSDEIVDLVWNCRDTRPDRIPSLVDINGIDGEIDVEPGQEYNVSLSGHRAMAKITLGRLCNGISADNIPQMEGMSPDIRCVEALLVNVPEKMTFRSPLISSITNSSESRTVDNSGPCVRIAAKGALTGPGEESEENLSLYSFPNGGVSDSQELVLCVAVQLPDGETYWYNIPIGVVTGGCEYAVTSLTVMKKGAGSPFDRTPTEAFNTEGTALQWSESLEGGYVGSKADGPLDYSLENVKMELEPPSNVQSLVFSSIYGESRVRSSDADVIDVRGAGRQWFLSAVSEGYATISLFDGAGSASVDMCSGPSIRWSWLGCDSEALDAGSRIYTYQRCTLKVYKWFGDLEYDSSATGKLFLTDEGGGTFLVYHSGIEGSASVKLEDGFEQVQAPFPGEFLDWDIGSCALSVFPTNGHVIKGTGITASLTLPFDISESALPVNVGFADPKGNVLKYGLSLSKTAEGSVLTVKVDTSSSLYGSDLGISVSCQIGSKKRTLFTIKKSGLQIIG